MLELLWWVGPCDLAPSSSLEYQSKEETFLNNVGNIKYFVTLSRWK